MDSNRYEHTQRSPLGILLALLALMFFGVAWNIDEPLGRYVMWGASGILVVFALSFAYLRVVGDEEGLELRYGPLPIFGKRIGYPEIGNAEAAQSSWIDGWGIHYVPRRGWTYNLWGFACVKLTLDEGKTLRVGSDDHENLARFVSQRITDDVDHGRC